MKNLKINSKTKFQGKITSLFIIITIALFSFTSCNGYPDGPLISLESRADRVANNWKVDQAIDNGKDVTTDYTQYELNLTKTGTASLTANYSVLGVKFNFTTTGTWSFLSDFKKISFDYDNDSADGVYVILKLAEKSMWLKKDAGTLELHLIPR